MVSRAPRDSRTQRGVSISDVTAIQSFGGVALFNLLGCHRAAPRYQVVISQLRLKRHDRPPIYRPSLSSNACSDYHPPERLSELRKPRFESHAGSDSCKEGVDPTVGIADLYGMMLESGPMYPKILFVQPI